MKQQLRKDNEMIKGELAIMMRSTNRNVSSSQQEIISKLQDQGDRMATSVDFEKRNIQTLEDAVMSIDVDDNFNDALSKFMNP